MKHVVIIGNGIAGITAARFIRKLSDFEITVVSGETDHHYARTALMYIYMGHMTYEDAKPYEDWFWAKNRIELVRGHVTGVDTSVRRIFMAGDLSLAYDKLIIATGSRPNRFGWPGQDLDAVQGLYGIPDLLEMDKWTRDVDRAVVVGGGLTGVEMVEMLHSRGIPVTFLVRESAYMDYLLPAEEAAMVAAEIREHGIDLRLGTELSAIHGSKGGRARSVTTSTGETIPCEFVGLTVGVSPNVAFLEDSGVEIGRGVLVDRHFETSVPGVYAIGDCAEFRQSGVGHSSVEQLWYAARRHGRTVARSVCGDRTAYDRGVHFNSAKFFDLEYQTYGTVAPAMMEGEDTLVWVPDTGRRLVRINFEQASGRVKGFNLLGVRFRHRICEEWLRQGASVSEVVAHLSEARFDPEFSFDAVSAARTRFRDRLASVSD